MSMEYGVQVTNKFAFLSDDEEDPFEALAKAETAKKDKPKDKKDKKTAAAAATTAAAAKPTAPVAVAKTEPETRKQPLGNKENAVPRGPRGGGPRGGFAPRVNFAERRDTDNRKSESGGDLMADRFGENRPPRGGGGGRGEGRGGGGRGFRGGDRGSFRGRPRSDNDGGFRSGGEGEEAREDNFRSRGGGGGGGGGDVGFRGRGGGGFRGGPRRGYALRGGGTRHADGDRHSGSDRTGIRPMDKKEGFGKGNWGTEKDELTGETEPTAPVSDTEVPIKEDRPTDESAPEVVGEEGEKKEGIDEEEKPKELTLAEWKKLHEKKDEIKFNIRKAGEGADSKIYSKLVPVQKDEEPEEHEEVIIVRREPREKPLNIEVNFSDSARPRGGDRGFRGGGGGRDREDFRGGRDRDDFRGGRDDFRGGRDDFRGGRDDFRGGRGGRGGGGRSGGFGRGGRRSDNFALNDDAFPALGKV